MTVNTGEASASYSLSERFIGGRTVKIDAEQFAALKGALATVVSTNEVEELFQVFAQSFLRFEKDLLDIAFEYAFASVHAGINELNIDNIRNRINVSILTILTSYKAYDDHCNRIFKSSDNELGAKYFNEELRGQVFDSHLSYRICAHLRDYAQHRSLPLGGFSIGGRTNIRGNSSGQCEKTDTGFDVSPWLDVTKFKKSNQCKAGVRANLEDIGCEKIDMKWLIRSFSGAMYERHEKLREFLRAKVVAAGQRIAEGYDLASKEMGGEAKYLQLCDDNKKRPMRNDLAAKVLSNFETCTSLKNAECTYVTSRITRQPATYAGST